MLLSNWTVNVLDCKAPDQSGFGNYAASNLICKLGKQTDVLFRTGSRGTFLLTFLVSAEF